MDKTKKFYNDKTYFEFEVMGFCDNGHEDKDVINCDAFCGSVTMWTNLKIYKNGKLLNTFEGVEEIYTDDVPQYLSKV